MKKLWIGITIVLVLALSLTTVAAAQAEEPPPPEHKPQHWRARLAAWRHPGMFQAYSQALADELGISIEDLRERVKAGESLLEIAQTGGMSDEDFQSLLVDVRDELISEALEQEKITEEEAEIIVQRWEESEQHAQLMRELRQQAGELLAEALEISTETMQERLENGESLFDIAQAQGLSEADFQTMFAGVQEQVLDQAVQDEKLTAAEAEKMKALLAEKGTLFQRVRNRLENMPGKEFLLPQIAQELGLDWEDIQERLDAGNTWNEIMDELGVAEEDLQQAAEALGLEIIQNAAESGLLPPERAERLKDAGTLQQFRWLHKSLHALQQFKQKLLNP